MKKKSNIIILLFLVPLFACAQITKVTEEQKQQALKCATDFCTYLSQWANGNRTLDSKIYNLCSGSDCSAYDDVTTKSETTLRNYLMGIQKKYPGKLNLQLSQPTLANAQISYEPEISISERIGSVFGNYDPASTTNVIDLNNEQNKNAYIAFKVEHSIPSLSVSNSRLLIYDVNSKKITAYVTGQGTFVSYIEGLNNMVEKKYDVALQKFHTAMENSRASLKYQSSLLAMICSVYLGDLSRLSLYAKNLNDPVFEKFALVSDYIQNDRSNEAYEQLQEFLKMVESDSKYEGFISFACAELAFLASSPQEQCKYRNLEKSVMYFRKAVETGNVLAGYALYAAYSNPINADMSKYISYEDVFDILAWSAECGHTGSMILVGMLYEESNMLNEAIEFFEAGANNGDPISMAWLGKTYIKKGDSTKGKEWLRKSLEGNVLDQQLQAYSSYVNDSFWPRNRSDIQALLSGNAQAVAPVSPSSSATVSQPTTANTNAATTNTAPPTSVSNSTNTNTTSTYTPNTNSSSHSTYTPPSNYSYTPSYSSYRYHRPFNEKKDNYFGGFSVGYIQKQWVETDEDEGETYKYGLFDDDKFYNGIQVGFRIDPQFGYGFGINTGVFYEYCWGTSDDQYDEYGTYTLQYDEHGIYIPLHLKYNMNFSKWFQLAFYGGIGFNYVVDGKLSLIEYGETVDSENVFEEEEDWTRTNFMLEYGAALRIGAFQLDFSISKGLNNWSDTDGIKSLQNRPFTISATYCF